MRFFTKFRHITPTFIKRNVVSVLSLVAVFLLAWNNVDFHTTPYLLDYPTNFGNRIRVPSDNLTTKEGVQLGRMLFYEKKLSANNRISCSSCHQQKYAFTDGKPFSEGVDQSLTSRNSMSLANLLWSRKFFWDGRSSSLEEQAVFPLTDVHEMGQPLSKSVGILRETDPYPQLFKEAFGDERVTADRMLKAIAQFERTLISANSRYDQFLNQRYAPTEQELRGMALFISSPQPQKNIRGANCVHCHGGVKAYMEVFHNNGLDNRYEDEGIQKLSGLPTDHGRFKAPTLRNIALTAPYMHDGRFNTLEEVLDHYNGHLSSNHVSPFLKGVSNMANGETLKLTEIEKAEIIAFLKMFTDSSFITNPIFSDPHQQALSPK